MTDIRVGNGYDIHRFTGGRKLVLGGITIPSEKGLDGHSDADVVVHSLMDALLGAAGLDDIGSFFPDTDPAYKNADSIELLKEVVSKIRNRGYFIINVDLTIIAEEPKLSSYKKRIKEKLAETLGISYENIGVKATTNETIGSIGRGEGIAVLATVLISK